MNAKLPETTGAHKMGKLKLFSCLFVLNRQSYTYTTYIQTQQTNNELVDR
jgi:hypothetical protein